MYNNKRKRRFTIESNADNDQLLVNKKCCKVIASHTEDTCDDENIYQSHPLISRSPQNLEDEDDDSDTDLLYIDSEPNSPQISDVQEEPARIQERPTNSCFLTDLASPTSKYVLDYHKTKQELIRRLYKFYNRTVFENQLPGLMDISWNKRLKKTAGRTGFRENNGERYAIIQLSDKVCNSADRLRDTIIHELCHAACWIIDGDGELAHHKLWEYYCRKAAQIHPDLPPITILHSW